MLNDGRVWKRHLDHIRHDSVDSAVSEENAETRAQDVAPHPVPQAILRPGVPFPHQPPEGVSVQQPMESRDQVQSESENNSHLPGEKPVLVETSSSDVCPTQLLRSSRVRKTPDRLIETTYLTNSLINLVLHSLLWTLVDTARI